MNNSNIKKTLHQFNKCNLYLTGTNEYKNIYKSQVIIEEHEWCTRNYILFANFRQNIFMGIIINVYKFLYNINEKNNGTINEIDILLPTCSIVKKSWHVCFHWLCQSIPRYVNQKYYLPVSGKHNIYPQLFLNI